MNNTSLFFNLNNSSIDIRKAFGGIQECCPCDPLVLAELLEKYTLIYNMLYVVLAVWIFDVVVNRGGFKKFFIGIRERIRSEHRRNKNR